MLMRFWSSCVFVFLFLPCAFYAIMYASCGKHDNSVYFVLAAGAIALFKWPTRIFEYIAKKMGKEPSRLLMFALQTLLCALCGFVAAIKYDGNVVMATVLCGLFEVLIYLIYLPQILAEAKRLNII